MMGLGKGDSRLEKYGHFWYLGGGFKHFLFLPRKLAKSSNLTSIFFKWVETHHFWYHFVKKTGNLMVLPKVRHFVPCKFLKSNPPERQS